MSKRQKKSNYNTKNARKRLESWWLRYMGNKDTIEVLDRKDGAVMELTKAEFFDNINMMGHRYEFDPGYDGSEIDAWVNYEKETGSDVDSNDAGVEDWVREREEKHAEQEFYNFYDPTEGLDYPAIQSKRCRFFKKGECKFGAKCKFKHEQGNDNMGKRKKPDYTKRNRKTFSKFDLGSDSVGSFNLTPQSRVDNISKTMKSMGFVSQDGEFLGNCFLMAGTVVTSWHVVEPLSKFEMNFPRMQYKLVFDGTENSQLWLATRDGDIAIFRTGKKQQPPGLKDSEKLKRCEVAKVVKGAEVQVMHYNDIQSSMPVAGFTTGRVCDYFKEGEVMQVSYIFENSEKSTKAGDSGSMVICDGKILGVHRAGGGSAGQCSYISDATIAVASGAAFPGNE